MAFSIVRLLVQFQILITKNALLALRNWKGTLGQLLSPVLIVLLLFGFQKMSDYVLSQKNEFPDAYPLRGIPKCIERKGIPCKTLLYAPQNVLWVQTIMRTVAERNGLDFESDFIGLGEGMDIRADNHTVYDYIVNHQNATQNGIFFYPAYFPGSNQTRLPKDLGYVLLYNGTADDSYVSQVMKAVDEAILSLKTGNTEVSIELNWRPWPRTPLRVSGYDVVAANGGVWFYVPPMVTFFILLTEIVMEKEMRLRLGMRMMGLSTAVYWLVWFVTGAVFSCLSTLVLIAIGNICQFSVFTNANFFAMFLLFFFFGIAMICFAFFLSTFINSSKTAQTAGYAIILVGFVFQTILCSGYGILVDMLYADGIATWIKVVRWILTFYPPFNLSLVYSDIAALSSNEISIKQGQIVRGQGFSWADMYKERHLPPILDLEIIVPPPINNLMWLLGNAAFYAILTWYFDNILAGEHGSPKPLYFFLTPEYWGFKSRPKQNAQTFQINEDEVKWDADVDSEKNETNRLSADDCGVRVVGLTKIYQKYPCVTSGLDLKAVNNLTFHVQKGEIFCLLGHNGAGKTTAIHMLTGLFAPTFGSATIFGKDVSYEMDEIRKLMGVCPQHSVLWNELTAREHLRIFAKLKGLRGAEVDSEIQGLLQQTSLTDVADQRVGGFSGGMKRRLSVAISAIGDPKIIFMDEPSTGMDPVNRASVWHLIQEMKKDRCIVLTTHFMQEAEVLGDRVGIMVYGQLRAIGTSLHLKNKYGSGYRVNVVTEVPMIPRLVGMIKESAPEVHLNKNDSGSLTFNAGSSQSIVPLLKFLESTATDDGVALPPGQPVVREWGISHTTLEDVFLQVTKKYDFHEYDDAESEIPLELVQAESTSIEPKVKSAPKSNPYRALIYKNFALQKRQKGTNCCQIITPVLVMAILVLLQLILRSKLGSDIDKKILVDTIPIPLNFDWSNNPFGSFTHLEKTLLRSSNDSGNKCLEFFFFTADPGINPGHLLSNGTGEGLLGHIPQRSCKVFDENMTVPYFREQPDIATMESKIYDLIQYLNSLPIDDVKKPPNSFKLPDGAVSFSKLDVNQSVISYTFSVNESPILSYHRANNFMRWDIVYNGTVLNQNDALLIIEAGKAALVSMIDDAFAAVIHPEEHSVMNTKLVQIMPYLSAASILDILEAFGTLLYPIALTLQLPVYISLIVWEKEEKLREMMKSQGMKMSTYWITNYLFNFLLFSIVVAFFWITGVVVEIRFFKQTDPSTLFFFFCGWGQALIALGFFFSSFLNSKRAAIVIGYIIALIGSLIGLVWCVGIYGKLDFSLSQTLPPYFLIWPQFAFIRGIYLMNDACADQFQCYGSISLLTWDDELSHVILALYLDAVVLFIAAIYLDQVLPKEYGIRKHPLFFLSWLWELKKKSSNEEKGSEAEPLLANGESADEDPDVREERMRVYAGNYKQGTPLVIHDLRKEFKSPDGKTKVAVDKLCLVVEHGECFGLLGENGAGKTTTISILTGIFPPTSGFAKVGGFDIRNEIDKVHLVMGVCPQFDIQWSSLTVREHLLFYARLKGVPRSKETEHVNKAIDQVGLRRAADRLSSDLSGGMKRRLSLAISLIGDTDIVFLDEPTTGLDPASRRQIWNIIHKAKKDRALILTTHNMDEAELLSSRIGILAKGKLRCVGKQQHLKNKFGSGYNLQISFPLDVEEKAHNFVLKSFPYAVERAVYRGTREYWIKKDSGLVSDMFVSLDKMAHEAGITDWSLAQVGMEDVFKEIVKVSHEEEILHE